MLTLTAVVVVIIITIVVVVVVVVVVAIVVVVPPSPNPNPNSNPYNRNASYILLLGLMTRKSLGATWEQIKTTAIPLIVSGLKLWPAAHIITYGLIPIGTW